jgi:hypothetical protein
MTEETQTQETAALEPPSDELTDAELTYVVGGVGTEGSSLNASKATPILL